ncbi:NUDIX hydrolase [Micromonospora sp. RTGN7]|uniref:NUDIX hydrolase n=1 Tax=Micromonospora sp. RTGN7 TaxID=3016526 RepID=UPI0029FEF965|nr:NUDIX hydrolase [Micromonospora sp. RTGN7]
MPDYIGWLRQQIGQAPIFLNFAGACVLHDGHVLLQRRSDDGCWGLPGGAMELGESAEEAAVREVAEETGLQVQIDGLLGVYTKYRHVYPNGDVTQPITVFFRCSVAGGQLTEGDRETQELRFFALSALPPLSHQQHTDALEDLRAGRAGVYR